MKHLFLILTIFLVANTALASDVFFSPAKDVALGEYIQTTILITADKPINAISGTITFDPTFVSLEAPKTGDSIVKYWLKGIKPKSSSGRVEFSGLIPGGFRGTNGKVVTLFFKTLREGRASIGLTNIKVLLNDGSGTSDVVTMTNTSVNILPKKNNTKIWRIKDILSDASSPENFVASIIKTDKAFDSKYFLAFSAEDSDSGVESFYMLESKIQLPLDTLYGNEEIKWREIENPAILKDQKLKSFIYVKSVDFAGNENIIEIIPTLDASGDSFINKAYKIAIIIIGLVVLVFGLSKLIEYLHKKK